jgi:hypothetical protein
VSPDVPVDVADATSIVSDEESIIHRLEDGCVFGMLLTKFLCTLTYQIFQMIVRVTETTSEVSRSNIDNFQFISGKDGTAELPLLRLESISDIRFLSFRTSVVTTVTECPLSTISFEISKQTFTGPP